MERWAGPATKKESLESKSPLEATEKFHAAVASPTCSVLRGEFYTPGNSFCLMMETDSEGRARAAGRGGGSKEMLTPEAREWRKLGL